MENKDLILEPACLYADVGHICLKELAEVVKDSKNRCRSAVVHMGEIDEMLAYLPKEKVVPVIDFPFGREGVALKREVAKISAQKGLLGADVVIDLWSVEEGNFEKVKEELEAVVKEFPKEAEIKAITQLPYLWQYARDKIEPLAEILVGSGIKVFKDWTTVKNFYKEVDFSTEARIEYTKFLGDIIKNKNLPLLIKIAGGVRDNNVIDFKKAGADLFGVRIQSVPGVLKSLEDAGY